MKKETLCLSNETLCQTGTLCLDYEKLRQIGYLLSNFRAFFSVPASSREFPQMMQDSYNSREPRFEKIRICLIITMILRELNECSKKPPVFESLCLHPTKMRNRKGYESLGILGVLGCQGFFHAYFPACSIRSPYFERIYCSFVWSHPQIMPIILQVGYGIRHHHPTVEM